MWLSRSWRFCKTRQPNAACISALVLVALLAIFFLPCLTGKSIFDVDLRFVESPFKWHFFKAEDAGLFPLWTNDIGCGYPLHAYGEGGLLYPLNWLIYPLMPLPAAHDVAIMLHLLIGGMGILHLCGKASDTPCASILSAVIYMFSGFMCVRLGHINTIQIMAWFPWCLFFLTQKKSSLIPQALKVGVCLALMFLAGRPQIAFYAWVGMAIYTIVETPSRKTRLCVLGLGTLFGAALAAGQLIPTWEFAHLSDRAQGLTYQAQLEGVVSWQSLLWLVIPTWSHGDTMVVAGESMGYVGMAAGLLILIGIRLNRKHTRTWWVMLVAALVFAMGDVFFFNEWIARLPGFSYFRTPARWLAVVMLPTAMLAHVGARALLKKIPCGRPRQCAGAALVLLVYLDLYCFARPMIQFLDRKVYNATPHAVQVMSDPYVRYLPLKAMPIFMEELIDNDVPERDYEAYFKARQMLRANMGMHYGVASVSSYTGIKVRWIAETLKRLGIANLSKMNMNCGYIITPLNTWWSLEEQGFREIGRNSFYRIYKNDNVQPRFYLAGDCTPADNGNHTTSHAMQGTIRPLSGKNHDELALQVSVEKPGYLVIRDTWYPGWRAWVNNKELPILRCNNWMRAIAVPEGDSQVVLRYQPFSFAAGCTLAVFAAMAGIVIAVYDKRKRKSKMNAS